MVLIGGWDFLFFTPLLLYRLLFASQQISLEFNHPFFIEFTNAISAQINVNCIETMCDFLPRTSESKQHIFSHWLWFYVAAAALNIIIKQIHSHHALIEAWWTVFIQSTTADLSHEYKKQTASYVHLHCILFEHTSCFWLLSKQFKFTNRIHGIYVNMCIGMEWGKFGTKHMAITEKM